MKTRAAVAWKAGAPLTDAYTFLGADPEGSAKVNLFRAQPARTF